MGRASPCKKGEQSSKVATQIPLELLAINLQKGKITRNYLKNFLSNPATRCGSLVLKSTPCPSSHSFASLANSAALGDILKRPSSSRPEWNISQTAKLNKIIQQSKGNCLSGTIGVQVFHAFFDEYWNVGRSAFHLEKLAKRYTKLKNVKNSLNMKSIDNLK